ATEVKRAARPPVPPPPPPVPPPAPVYAPTYAAPLGPPAPPPAPRRSNTGMIVGLGCFVVFLIVLIGGGIVGYRYFTSRSPQQEPQAKQEADKPLATTPKKSTSDKGAEPSSSPTSAQTAPAQPTAAVPQPGEQRAADAALQGESSWQWQIKYHTDGWQRAKIWIGPSASRLTTEVVLQWSSSNNKYSIERKSAIQRVAPRKPSRKRTTSRANSRDNKLYYDKDGRPYYSWGQNW
ncbi:MAG: hypothetical protein WCP21_05265, partial [Armatimonadota bacterium]